MTRPRRIVAIAATTIFAYPLGALVGILLAHRAIHGTDPTDLDQETP